MNFTFHTVFPLRALQCLFITHTSTGNFSGINLLCPDPFSQPCSFSKPVILLWVAVFAGSDPLWRKVIPWPSQLAGPRLFLVPASWWSLLFGVRQSPAFIFWQALFKQRHRAVGGISKSYGKHYLYYELWSTGYQNRIWYTKQPWRACDAKKRVSALLGGKSYNLGRSIYSVGQVGKDKGGRKLQSMRLGVKTAVQQCPTLLNPFHVES